MNDSTGQFFVQLPVKNFKGVCVWQLEVQNSSSCLFLMSVGGNPSQLWIMVKLVRVKHLTGLTVSNLIACMQLACTYVCVCRNTRGSLYLSLTGIYHSLLTVTAAVGQKCTSHTMLFDGVRNRYIHHASHLSLCGTFPTCISQLTWCTHFLPSDVPHWLTFVAVGVHVFDWHKTECNFTRRKG